MLTVVIFIAAKLVFMLVNYEGHAFGVSDVVAVIAHGLSLDLSTSLYFLILPFLITLVSLWWDERLLHTILRIYYGVIATMLMLAFVADTSLYPFWGFKLDASCLQYLEAPAEVRASVSGFYMAIRLILLFLGSYALYRLYKAIPFWAKNPSRREAATATNILFIPLIVIGIRGGLDESTTNIGQVYFSQNQFLNHSAVNPVFSFLFGAAGVMALAVPGTAGFVGEFTVLLSLWDLGPLPALVGGFCLILSATYVLRFVQKVIFGKPAREYQEGTRTTALEGVAFGSMLALLLAFGLHPAFVTNSLHLFDEGITEELTTEVVEEVAEPAEQPMTAEELRELDSTLAASGFTEEERKALIAQIQSETLAVDSAVAASEAAEDSVEAQGAAEEQAAGTDSSAAGAESPAVETEKTEASENE